MRLARLVIDARRRLAGTAFAAGLVGLSVGIGASAPAAAQTVLPSPSAALACMTPPAGERGVPEYDPGLVERKEGGTVAVELTFAAADAPPEVRVTSPFVGTGLVGAVTRHVQKFRVPCLEPGSEPVRVQMEFVFVPNDGRKVVASAPRDADEARRRQLSACLTRITGSAQPEYPREARRAGAQGTVILRLRFTSPTEPPQQMIVARPKGDRWLAAEIERFALGYRLPCLGQEPHVLSMIFRFRLDGEARTVINDLPLLTLLRSAEGLPQPVFFDLDRLGCPFDVRVQYLRPHQRNQVHELGTSRPERRAFLDWLSLARLKLDADLEERVLGDSFVVNVPCGKIDL